MESSRSPVRRGSQVSSPRPPAGGEEVPVDKRSRDKARALGVIWQLPGFPRAVAAAGTGRGLPSLGGRGLSVLGFLVCKMGRCGHLLGGASSSRAAEPGLLCLFLFAAPGTLAGGVSVRHWAPAPAPGALFLANSRTSRGAEQAQAHSCVPARGGVILPAPPVSTVLSAVAQPWGPPRCGYPAAPPPLDDLTWPSFAFDDFGPTLSPLGLLGPAATAGRTCSGSHPSPWGSRSREEPALQSALQTSPPSAVHRVEEPGQPPRPPAASRPRRPHGAGHLGSEGWDEAIRTTRAALST